MWRPFLETKDFFRGVDLFKYLGENQLERLASMAVKRSIPDGIIIKEQGADQGLYILESGVAQVTKSAAGAAGSEAVLATLHQGNCFGELSLIDGLPRSANVTAIGPIVCYFLPREAFIHALMETPQIALAMLQSFASMVRSANNWASYSIDGVGSPRQRAGVRSFRL